MSQTVTVQSIDITPAGKTKRIVLNYKNSKGEARKIGALEVKLDETSRSVLSKSHPGDTVVIDMAKEGEYWNLTKVTDVTSFVSSSPNNSSVSTSYAKKSNTYDDTGVKVGASRNQAIAYLAATMGCNFTLDDVDRVAYEIVNRQAAQEANVRAGTTPIVGAAKTKKSDNGSGSLTLDQEHTLLLETQYAQAHDTDLDF